MKRILGRIGIKPVVPVPPTASPDSSLKPLPRIEGSWSQSWARIPDDGKKNIREGAVEVSDIFVDRHDNVQVDIVYRSGVRGNYFKIRITDIPADDAVGWIDNAKGFAALNRSEL